MKIKLHWKLAIVFYATLLFAVIFGFFYLTSHLKSSFQTSTAENTRRALSLGKNLLDRVCADNPKNIDFQSLGTLMGESLGFRVTIIAYDGTVVGDSSLTKEQVGSLENHANRPEIEDALKKGFGTSTRYSYTIKKYMLYTAIPFGKDEVRGVLRYSLPITEMELLQDRGRSLAGMAILAILLLGLGLTLFVSYFVTRPLATITSTAKAMAKGDFSKKASIKSRDEIGELAYALNTMSEDIQNKINAINSEKAKLDLVLSSMFEGVMVTDEKETIMLINPSLKKLFFLGPDPEGKKSIEVIRNSAVQEMVDRILKGRQRFATDEIIVNTPEEKILKVNGVSILNNDKLEGAILVFHDITELRRLEQIRQDFVANVSHELRTPIASIKGYAETLLDGALEDKNHSKEFVNIIYQDSTRLANLINDLLDISKIESGKMNLSFAPIDPVTAIKRTVTVIDNQAASKSVKIQLNIPEGIPEIFADQARFSQVMINLLDNAVKYTPEGGTVIVSAKKTNSVLQIDISDTGIGISEIDLPRIFERFYRVDKARSRDLGGTGLGLSIVKHIVQAHNGQVWVTSELGKGSTFSFTIPLTQDSSPHINVHSLT